MKKRTLGFLMAVLLLSAMLAVPVGARTEGCAPSLDFSGSTAYCDVTCRGKYTSDAITLTMTLRENGTPIAGWNGSGTGTASLSKTCTVKSGATYTLVVNWTLNGTANPPSPSPKPARKPTSSFLKGENSMFKRIRRKALGSISLVLALAMLLSASALAASYSPGTNQLIGTAQNMTVSSTLTYSSNTTTAINVTQLSNYVTNNGSLPVNHVVYEVFTGDQSKTTRYDNVSPTIIETGKSGRIEIDWLTMCKVAGYTNTVFTKSKAGNSDNYVYVNICAGSNVGLIGGWEIFCYPSTFDPYFHA